MDSPPSGIRERRWVSPGQSTGDLAVEAGRRALSSAGLEGVDAVVLATSSPDRHCPATAPEVATRLGLGPVPAFDVAAVCTGFVYALATGAGMVALGAAQSVLVVGADAFSTLLAPDDRSTRVIFGDGGGAVVLRAGSPTEPGALTGLNLGSDGSLSDLIEVPVGGSRQRSTGLPAKTEDTYFSCGSGTTPTSSKASAASSLRSPTASPPTPAPSSAGLEGRRHRHPEAAARRAPPATSPRRRPPRSRCCRYAARPSAAPTPSTWCRCPPSGAAPPPATSPNPARCRPRSCATDGWQGGDRA